MKKALARFRHVGGFVAGVLVGLAMTLPVVLPATSYADPGETLLLFASVVLFITGIALRAAVSK